MLAIAGLLLLHVPPAVASLRVVVVPKKRVAKPPIAAGKGLTLTMAEALQPVAAVKVTEATPADTPVIVPEEGSAATTAGLPDTQLPMPEPAMVVVVPTHRAAPDRAAGTAFTVTIADTEQPDVNV